MPIALHTENLPPTKSQNPNTLFSSIPNFEVYGMLVEQAQICDFVMSVVSVILILAYCERSQVLQLFALSIVYAVVKVFELTKIRVSSTSNPSIARLKSMGSTLAKNLIFLFLDFST